jgi:ER-bound oxygenase mpaB/B'/Rubber oxygenase, catalytic domain
MSLTKTAASPASGNGRWTDDLLEAARQQGDPEADGLAGLIFARPALARGRLGYNHLVDLADVLGTDAELLLIRDSNFGRQIEEFPPELQYYYNPMPAPDWVDAAKLRLASQLWEDNSLAMLGVLYAASLPACYLIKNGIPALYNTEKLRDHKYIFQRIYETGLMLDSVMDSDGIRLVNDVHPEPDQVFEQALAELDPDGQWKHTEDGRITRTSSGASPARVPDWSKVQAEFDRLKAKSGAGRFLWGKGYLTAKKVRLLHASMRHMLLHPGAIPRTGDPSAPARLVDRLSHQYQTQAWPTAERGVPVNQEDLAYTLLTFSYLLPKGLEDWGCRLSLDQKEAFLHQWRVVGHIMGLRDDLMTDQWQEAEDLFNQVLRRQGGQSEAGRALTSSVMWFLATYLPSTLGLREILPGILIEDQMRDRAKALLYPEDQARVGSLRGRCWRLAFRLAVGGYYRFYQRFLEGMPIGHRLFSGLFHQASEELVRSWRDEYSRHPFYVPKDLTTWQRVRGVDEATLRELRAWRERIFIGIFLPVALLGLAGLTGIISLALLALKLWGAAAAGACAALAMIGLALWRMDVSLPKLYGQRPDPPQVKARHST